jgi:hypothetical protein
MKWEAEGYRPDEYSRWVKGVWRQIAELWAELGIDPARVTPIDSSCSERLKKPDVQHTKYRCRCAQPPYDILPIPRADIPEGILLSREGNAWVREEAVEDVALPLYEGRMIGQFDFSQKGWVSGKGRGAVWEDLTAFPRAIQPQYLMHLVDYCMHLSEKEENGPTSSTVYFTTYARARGVSIMDVTSSTNARTTIATVGPAMPHGHSAPILRCADPLSIAGVMNSFVFDWTTRLKQSGLHLVWSVLEELPLPPWSASMSLILRHAAAVLILTTPIASIESVRLQDRKNFWNNLPALTEHEILRRRVCIDVLVGVAFGLTSIDMRSILYMCDMPHQGLRDHAIGTLDPKGFWRLDKNKSPELRHTVLTLVAFHDLEEKIRACGGDREKGIEAFLAQNNGEGWMLPETLCLADYGIGHDERAKQPQPVASRLGPRFYDWQLAQTGEESWRECHLHARNLLGEAGYRKLLEDIETEKRGEKRPQEIKKENLTPGRKKQQGNLFE